MFEGGRKRGGDGADQTLDVGVGDAGLAPGGVVDAVGGLGDGGVRGDLLRRPKLDLCAAGHRICILD